MNKTDKAQIEIVKSTLTWGHKITLIGLGMSAVLMLGGLVLLILHPYLVQEIIDYIREWIPFCVSVILGYSAKTTLENGVKIYAGFKEMKEVKGNNQSGGNG